MAIRTLFTYVILFLLLGFSHGCVTLPDYGKPRFVAPGTDGPGSKEGFSYRQLERKDFQASSLPETHRQYSHNIGAQSCVSIRPSKDAKITIVQSRYDTILFFAGTLKHVAFEAIFVPECSWWNPGIPKDREEYVLQHEQIHFALAELAARELTSKAVDEMKNYLAIGNSHQEVQDEIAKKLKAMGEETMQVNLKEHTAFDKDTSLYYDPRVQKRWLQNVNIRLADEDNLETGI